MCSPLAPGTTHREAPGTFLPASDRRAGCPRGSPTSAWRTASSARSAGRPWTRSRRQSPASYFFRKAIAKTIKHEVADEKYRDRCHAERDQPLPMAVRAREEQHLLIRDHDVRHRVELQPRAHVGRNRLHRVDDRSGEKPELHQVAEQIL